MIQRLRYLFFCLAILLATNNFQLVGQAAWWVYFTDKGQSDMPGLSSGQLQEDREIPAAYREQVQRLVSDTLGSSLWLNAMLVHADQQQIGQLSTLPYVRNCQLAKGSIRQEDTPDIRIRDDYEQVRQQQVESLGYSHLKRLKLDGTGIRIAVFDGGFPDVSTHEAFRHLMENDRIIATWNFPDKRPDVFADHPHGTQVLSCIAGYYGENPTGLATGAEFLLARTELKSEPYREQLYWIQAAEWAWRNGADIISSSLGYTEEHYFPEQMDGSSPVAEAARVAFSKGILVINSYGNDGDSKWRTGGTPADAAEVLSVGAIDPATGLKMSFSSLGPNQKWVVKPNVVAAGQALVAHPGGYRIAYGTSFSAPLITGLAACLWQQNPDKTNVEIFELIVKSGHLYPYFDYAHGYGLPGIADPDQACEVGSAPELAWMQVAGRIILSLPDDWESDQLLYYHFADASDRIINYQVARPDSSGHHTIVITDWPDAFYLRIRSEKHYLQIPLK